MYDKPPSYPADLQPMTVVALPDGRTRYVVGVHAGRDRMANVRIRAGVVVGFTHSGHVHMIECSEGTTLHDAVAAMLETMTFTTAGGSRR
jgi:hypothetical protein